MKSTTYKASIPENRIGRFNAETAPKMYAALTVLRTKFPGSKLRFIELSNGYTAGNPKHWEMDHD